MLDSTTPIERDHHHHHHHLYMCTHVTYDPTESVRASRMAKTTLQQPTACLYVYNYLVISCFAWAFNLLFPAYLETYT